MTNPSNFVSHQNKSIDYRRAKQLRHNSTDGESILWYELRRATKDTGFRFRRQHPLHPYIVDFVCLKLQLIIEVDGTSHEARFEADQKRSKHLNNMGYKILRFTNGEVIQNREGVVQAILNYIEQILSDR